MRSRNTFTTRVVLTLAVIASVPVSPAAGETLVDRLATLGGEWEGRYEWTGARTGGGAISARYHVTGNGSAVVEDLVMGERTVMTSVYHMDGDEVRLTHYCAAGNQPRMKASSIQLDEGVVVFDMTDITNLARPEAAHIHRIEVRMEDRDHLELRFTQRAEGRESLEVVKLQRKGERDQR